MIKIFQKNKSTVGSAVTVIGNICQNEEEYSIKEKCMKDKKIMDFVLKNLTNPDNSKRNAATFMA